ncbi:MAG: T9SS type A sorting domain-containing protein [Candidatus Krumholzibacteria bacterium]|nr:T9SS type A sorting domain-containing protein [Candidatus Krumholzibacteria bacterium]MDH4335667.1 T9SS type A sorting domain-containing protein [Candidatus Krumholzibacteria bacterium]MDH5270438.1 T9SS type A sorting domain-containing protein [Candidatus Krumholzibacteria bacterium]
MKHTRTFALLAVACAAVLAVSHAAFADGVQLLTNPGFETGGGSYAGWTSFGSGVQISTPGTDNIIHTGTAASKVYGEFNNCPIPTFDVGGYFQSFTPTAGQVYTFSGYSFVSSADPMPGNDTCVRNRAIAKIVFYNAAVGGAEMATNEVIIGNWSSPLDAWVPFSVSAPAPVGALRVQAMILFLQPGCDTGAVFVDDLLFCEGAPVASPNVLVNPSFNTDLSGWTTFGNVFYDNRSFARRTPTGAAKLFGTFTPGSDSGMYQSFAAVPGERWLLSVYALNTCAENAIRGTNEDVALARIVYRNNVGADLGGADVIIANNTSPLGTWTRYLVTATAPVGAVSVDAFILFTQGVFLENGAVFVDDAAFAKVTATGVEDTPSARGAELHQNIPNPFNPSTQITFDLVERDNVEISVYDVNGHRVTTLFKGSMDAGSHAVTWDGTAASGERVSSGVYMYSLRTSSDQITRRMVLLK